MPLTETHLRYLFAIHECAAQQQDLSSRVLADRLGVKKPSVVRLLEVLMEKKLIVKKHYGKIYLTDRGAFTVRYYTRLLKRTLEDFPDYGFPVSEEQRRSAALALVAALPDEDYRCQYEALFDELPDAEPPVPPSVI